MRKRNIKVRRLKDNIVCDNFLNRVISDRNKICDNCLYYLRIDNNSYCKKIKDKLERKLV